MITTVAKAVVRLSSPRSPAEQEDAEGVLAHKTWEARFLGEENARLRGQLEAAQDKAKAEAMVLRQRVSELENELQAAREEAAEELRAVEQALPHRVPE